MKREKRTYSETLSSVPSPLDGVRSGRGHSDTSDGRDDRVSGLRGEEEQSERLRMAKGKRTNRDGPGKTSTDHEPSRRDRESDGEGEHLDLSVALEGARGYNAVFDRIGRSSSYGDGTCEGEEGQWGW